MRPSSLIRWAVVALLPGVLALPKGKKNDGLRPADLVAEEYIIQLKPKVSADAAAEHIEKVKSMLEEANRLHEIERKENDLPPLDDDDKYQIHWTEPSSYGAKIDDKTLKKIKNMKKASSSSHNSHIKVKSVTPKAKRPESDSKEEDDDNDKNDEEEDEDEEDDSEDEKKNKKDKKKGKKDKKANVKARSVPRPEPQVKESNVDWVIEKLEPPIEPNYGKLPWGLPVDFLGY